MAKKSIKDTAAAGTSVFDQIIQGNIQDAPDVLDVQDVQDVQDVPKVRDVPKRTGRPPKTTPPLERLNLKIPAEIKEYLTVAAAKASIEQRRNISLTEYLIQIVREDMAKNNE